MAIRKGTSEKKMHSVIIGERGDAEDEVVDFSNASLYLSAIQTILSVLACAATAILACWLLPTSMVSAVRTLTLTCLVAAITMRKPLSIGQVHGLTLIFSALRPAVVVYISCLVIETLLHTCTQESDEVPSWRRVVFQTAVVGMMLSGILRARQPLSTTDTPFLLTAACLLLVAVLPPPAVSMQGPLCQSVSVVGAAERMVRALVFACVYSLFVYISSPTNNLYGGTAVCIMRASAASVWVLGAALPLLLFAIPQCGIAIWARLRIDDEEASRLPLFSTGKSNGSSNSNGYNALATQTPPPETRDLDSADDEAAIEPHLNGVSHMHVGALSPAPVESPPATAANGILSTPNSLLSRSLGPLSFKPVGSASHTAHTQPSANVPSKERMAEIAATMVASEASC
jgi:hypothetical protein